VKPVKPLNANVVYRGPTPEIGDLECVRLRPGLIRTQWRVSADELAWLAGGADIFLEIFGEPIPPVSVGVTEPFCPECMKEMRLEFLEGAIVDGTTIETHATIAAHWHFRCASCRRWA
jgi:hypothetical protein